MAQTLKNTTGISFDGAAIIDFNGFKGVIDALGGVQMCVDQRVKSHHMVMGRRPADVPGRRPQDRQAA